MGDDLLVVNAARVSMDRESEYEVGFCDDHILPEKDKKLLSYLAKHNHWTPFSHPQICMRETVPIFVARQRFKHMVGFTYNEVSRRYVDTPPEFYTPDVWRSRPEGSIKQGSGEGEVRYVDDRYFGDVGEPISYVYENLSNHCEATYQAMVDGGVAPEQARMVLPQSMMTSYYVTGSLSAWARAYKLRIDSHSQVEIQMLAKQWGDIIQPLFPECWEVLTGESELL
jgi:thymidylate synthase (FAD)